MGKPFNSLTPAQAERLDMLAEEAAEIVVAVSKIKRHGLYSSNPDDPDAGNNIDQLNDEIHDLHGVIIGMQAAGDQITAITGERAIAAWKRKLRYSHHQGKQ